MGNINRLTKEERIALIISTANQVIQDRRISEEDFDKINNDLCPTGELTDVLYAYIDEQGVEIVGESEENAGEDVADSSDYDEDEDDADSSDYDEDEDYTEPSDYDAEEYPEEDYDDHQAPQKPELRGRVKPASAPAFIKNSFNAYCSEIGRVPLLTAQQEIELARRIRKGDKAALRQLIDANLRLVVYVARRNDYFGNDIMDRIQDGNRGLIRAAKKFDPERGVRFSTYAIHWIKSEMKRGCIKDLAFTISAHDYERVRKIKKAENEFYASYGCYPNVNKLAEMTCMTPRQIVEGQRMSARPLDIDAPIKGCSDESIFLRDTIVDPSPTPEELAIKQELREAVDKALNSLDERENRILRLHFGIGDRKPMTLEDIGKIVGVSRERARQLELRGLKKLGESPLRELLEPFREDDPFEDILDFVEAVHKVCA